MNNEWKNPYGPNPPAPVRTESGCKVGWNFYSNIEDAERCSCWAQEEAKFRASRGYDFGYQNPGRVEPVADGFRVTIP